MIVINVLIILLWFSLLVIFFGFFVVEIYFIIYGWLNRKLFGILWLFV